MNYAYARVSTDGQSVDAIRASCLTTHEEQP